MYITSHKVFSRCGARLWYAMPMTVYCVGYPAAVFLALVGRMAGIDWLKKYALVLSIATLAVCSFGIGLLWVRRPLVRRITPDLHCGRCGYSLEGLERAVCPECGIDLRGGVWLAVGKPVAPVLFAAVLFALAAAAIYVAVALLWDHLA